MALKEAESTGERFRLGGDYGTRFLNEVKFALSEGSRTWSTKDIGEDARHVTMR